VLPTSRKHAFIFVVYLFMRLIYSGANLCVKMSGMISSVSTVAMFVNAIYRLVEILHACLYLYGLCHAGLIKVTRCSLGYRDQTKR
jgi:hypothetical protein